MPPADYPAPQFTPVVSLHGWFSSSGIEKTHCHQRAAHVSNEAPYGLSGCLERATAPGAVATNANTSVAAINPILAFRIVPSFPGLTA